MKSKNELTELMKYIAKKCLTEIYFWDMCVQSGVDINLWPNCSYKKIMQDYVKHREKESHHFATVQLYHLFESVEDTTLEIEDDYFKHFYEKTITHYLANELAAKIKASPLDVEKIISEFSLNKNQSNLVSLPENFDKYLKESIRQTESGEAERIIQDWPLLSERIGGFNPGRVGILMADTGFGKTTLSINLALSASKTFSVVYFNMEMIEQDFAEKFIMSGAEIDYKDYKKNIVDKKNLDRIAEFYGKIIDKKIYFSKGKGLSTSEIFSICRNHKKNSGLDFIVVDYDQKIVLNTSKEMPEWKALQIAIESFEALAKELQCYVLILAQESAEGDISGSRRSKFPASTVLRFYKDESDQFLIEALKNRFGARNERVEVEYVPQKNIAREKGSYVKPEPKYDIVGKSFDTFGKRTTRGMGKRGF